ncbi:AMP-binding protein [Galbitalea soli]|uniref:AMP-binding protein n=1 Tax=Galbitalea soli TaxID=1268042 RepID=A0A7C9PMT7_9MICO|nr:AMP-binding protein [Galbitalea soli]NEM91011.1 AMP-binding protein [Galbitalea soli]NYJ29698.1 O-succinylbenzoic acid--CoA ligase [Galbitalea soli]
MTRPLRVVPAAPATVLDALREALDGSGPALLVESPRPAGAPSPAPLPTAVPRRVALVVETSGSTATPKRVALSANALLASAAASAQASGGEGQWLLALPVHYIAGLNVLVRSIAARTDPVVMAPGHFDVEAFATAAERLDADHRFTSLVPAQLGALLESDRGVAAARRFTRILVGGQSTPLPLRERAAELGVAITRTYGSSETAGGCVYDGVPIGATTARVVEGELQLSGAVLAEGYLGDEERTAERFVRQAGVVWYRTGDTGSVTATPEGQLVAVSGRLDDVIISGGLKVSLADVERVIRALPGQTDAVVVRAADARWGEVPVVVTTVPVALAELRERIAAVLGSAASPARVIVVDALPMLPSGKPDRRTAERLAQ